MTHFVDISTLHAASWEAPRGITRVEYNVAREASALGAELVRFDGGLNGLIAAELPAHFGRAPDPVKMLLAGTPTIRPPFGKRAVIRRMAALGELLSKAWPIVPEAEKKAAREELAWELAHNYEFLPADERLALADYAHALKPQALCHEFDYWVMIERGGRAWQRGTNTTPVQLKRGDKLLSLGAVWEHAYIEALERLIDTGVSVVVLVHDMIPITHPSFLPRHEVERFERFIERIVTSSIRLATGSRSSEQEITNYCRAKWGISKEVALTRWGSSVSTVPAVASAQIREAGLEKMGFVLMAGSFEPRKNQMFLIDLWRTVAPNLAESPALVFAGGLASATYLEELRRGAADLDRVFFLFNVADEELAWLYENCLFTVFPSEAEGWGLPVTEALDRGKYCLASDNTSLKEAGEGLVFHAALHDRAAWIKALCTLLTNPLALEQRTKTVRETHRSRTWADAARDLMAL